MSKNLRSEDIRHKMYFMRRILFIFLVIIIYGFGVYFFNNHFYPRSYINGRNYGLKSPSYVTNNIPNFSSNHILKIKGISSYDEIYSKDFDFIEYISYEEVAKLKEREGSLLWPIKIFVKNEYRPNVRVLYDQYKFSKIYDGLDLSQKEKIKKSVNATLSYSESGEIKVIKEVYGTEVDKDTINNKILDSFKNNIEEIDLKIDNLYIKPKITANSKELSSLKKKLENFKTKELLLSVDPERQVRVPFSEYKHWILTDQEGNISVDESKIEKYVSSIADKYNTYYNTRSFKKHDGSIVSVKAGNYGRRVNVKGSVEEIKKELKNNNTKINLKLHNNTLNNAEDIGGTYIEVDLENQNLYAYKDYKLILETPIVSGNPNTGGETPKGVYKIWSRERNRNLVGEDYSSPVSYWMPCTYTGVGLHDASWQPSFGGKRYLYAGSHGCINMPYSKVKFIYENYITNTPVIIY